MHRVWLKWFFGGAAVWMLLVMGVNSVVDSLWMHVHSFQYPPYTEIYDERQQKVNEITYGDVQADALVLGSSRTSYINAHDFTGYRAYNLSVSAMYPEEYIAYSEYLKEHRNLEFSTIFLGLDFESTNGLAKPTSEEPEVYINKANDPFYRLRMLANWDVLTLSVRNLYDYWTGQYKAPYYDRQGARHPILEPMEARQTRVKTDLRRFRERYYGENYAYNEQLAVTLGTLRDNNKNASFRVFTTPVSRPVLELMVQQQRWDEYERWLRDLVSVFGEVHHYMYDHSVAANPDLFMDAHHFYPQVGTWIAHQLVGQADATIPEDFGIVLTAENVDEQLARLRAQAELLVGASVRP